MQYPIYSYNLRKLLNFSFKNMDIFNHIYLNYQESCPQFAESCRISTCLKLFVSLMDFKRIKASSTSLALRAYVAYACFSIFGKFIYDFLRVQRSSIFNVRSCLFLKLQNFNATQNSFVQVFKQTFLGSKLCRENWQEERYEIIPLYNTFSQTSINAKMFQGTLTWVFTDKNIRLIHIYMHVCMYVFIFLSIIKYYDYYIYVCECTFMPIWTWEIFYICTWD